MEVTGEIKKMMMAIPIEDLEGNQEEVIALDIIGVDIKEVDIKIKEIVGETKIGEDMEAMEAEKKLGIVIMKTMNKIIIKMEEKKTGVDKKMIMDITKKEEDMYKIRVVFKNIVRTLGLEPLLVSKGQMCQ